MGLEHLGSSGPAIASEPGKEWNAAVSLVTSSVSSTDPELELPPLSLRWPSGAATSMSDSYSSLAFVGPVRRPYLGLIWHGAIELAAPVQVAPLCWTVY